MEREFGNVAKENKKLKKQIKKMEDEREAAEKEWGEERE